MKVEIWSDVVCPFCYIGKRHFENALKDFAAKESVEIVWRSFQLDPSIKPNSGQTLNDYLAKRKGITLEHAREMNEYVTQAAQQVGLSYNLDKAVVANTLNAHRLIHLAAKHGLADQAEERLFIAYFTEGKDIGNTDILLQLGIEIGLNAEEVKQVLESDRYTQEVQEDQYLAGQVGARGVPFFVFNNKYAVSGAQPSSVFAKALQKAHEEEQLTLTADGGFCTPDGICQ
ncbi:DsbA family oxidoreductase [Rhodocytophaga aerolata]|uniref:DsbA family oxidoreductase n=1 Tax=Rhodocytophaga aerolata TaxID=455078 RepID=A0ABT8RFK1_9BACT|nr:DsbA family oxidoreductase [Rhodocytophaga aerolata]MDO1450886.1 DsbA family oxidoreductase [Rhodocytophaga aerolata]